jgi:DNA-binding response OmpR family regulator
MRTPANVLVVDDEPNIRLVFRTALGPSGYTVLEAKGGQEALDCLEIEPVDVVLLDLLMPGLGGIEVLRRLRDRGDETPVVVVTAHGTIPDAVEAMKLGAIDFLTKPLSPEALRGAVADVIARHAAPDSETGTETELQTEAEPTAVDAGPHAPTTVVVGPVIVSLMEAKRALNLRQFDKAAALLEAALDLEPHSAEGQTLLGVLYESRGQDHAAYHAYKTALSADPHYGPALDNLRRYCERFGLDVHSKAINPAAS